MSNITPIPKAGGQLVSHAEQQAAIRTALKTSLYPGATDESIDLVLAYCTAAGLDPMQKPVHIVPMWDGKNRTMRDVVMPGIGLYRVQASRSGQFAGMSEPEFGPMVTEYIGTHDVTFPEWCRVTVRRQLASGHIAEFTAVEYWLENYAIKGGKDQDQSPNAMWSKRKRGQLAKCTQAQALRMAFPEFGSMPTAEEMEGKTLHDDVAAAPAVRAELQPYPDADFAKNISKWGEAIEAGKHTAAEIVAKVGSKFALTEDQKARIFDFEAPAVDAEFEEVADEDR